MSNITIKLPPKVGALRNGAVHLCKGVTMPTNIVIV